jgi:hypothetical protein
LNKFCGIDRAEDHHDVAVIDAGGQLVIKRRIADDADGFAELLGMLESVGDTSDDPIPVASRPLAACWLLRCAPQTGRCMRSTRWRSRAIANGTR